MAQVYQRVTGTGDCLVALGPGSSQNQKPMHAEDAYLFRHTLLREAAYQLQLPSERARLHRLALEVIEDLFAGSLRPFAESLAEHARHAQAVGTELEALATKEVSYLEMAAEVARDNLLHDVALRHYDGVAKHPQAELRTRLEASYQTGKILWLSGRPAEAREYFAPNLELAAQLGNNLARCESLCALGVISHETGNVVEAQSLLEEALELARKEKHVAAEVQALGNLSGVYRDLGRVAEARIMLQRTVDLCREAKLRHAQGLSLFNLAAMHHTLGDLAVARRIYEESTAILRETGNARTEAVALGNLATLHRALGETDQAERLYTCAIELSQQVGSRRFAGINLGNIASIHAERGRDDQALAEYCESARILREIGDVQHEGLTRGNMANFYAERGLFARAQHSFAQALALLDSPGSQTLSGAFRGLRGRLRLLLGDRVGAQDDAQFALMFLEPRLAPDLRAEYALTLNARLQIDSACQGQDGALESAQANLAEMREIATLRNLGPQTSVGKAVSTVVELLAEFDSARLGQRPALLFGGHRVQEISKEARAALLARMAKREPRQLDQLAHSQPALVAALRAGAGTAPDWEGIPAD